MILRDKLNTEEGYKEIISLNTNFILKRLKKIKAREKDEKQGVQNFPKSNLEIIKSAKKNIISYKCDIIKTRYSLGEDIVLIKKGYLEILTFVSTSNQVYGYANLLSLVSMGIMLEIKDSEFEILTQHTKQYIEIENEEDFLIDFLIRSRNPKWKQSNTFIVNTPYKIIKEVIELSVSDKNKASERLKKYIEKDWYKGLIEVETHKSKHNVHKGYWSWEAGAVAKILGLEDHIPEQQYYPYDMVQYTKANT